VKLPQVETPELTDAEVKAKTGKTLKQWFAELDRHGGLELGRRDLVSCIYDATDKNIWWSTTLVVEYERAKGQKEKDGRPTGYSICSTKTIAAPLERVFAAFGDAKQLDQWLGPKTKLEFAEGGSFANGDGDRGTFKKVRANKDIRLSWDGEKLAPGTTVDVAFADKGKGKTGITLNHTRIQSRKEADQVREAWSAAFDTLKALLEKP
jgi:uncharacterized protein YndB with AHSA1/START domain